jgi:hypothetical protein
VQEVVVLQQRAILQQVTQRQRVQQQVFRGQEQEQAPRARLLEPLQPELFPWRPNHWQGFESCRSDDSPGQSGISLDLAEVESVQ